jgi:nitrogen regulatory protein P-II 1
VKLITAVVRPVLFDQLKEALALFGVRSMTVTQAFFARDGEAKVESYRGRPISRDFEPSLRIELLVENGEVVDLARVIGRIVAPYSSAEGHVWITDTHAL